MYSNKILHSKIPNSLRYRIVYLAVGHLRNALYPVKLNVLKQAGHEYRGSKSFVSVTVVRNYTIYLFPAVNGDL